MSAHKCALLWAGQDQDKGDRLGLKFRKSFLTVTSEGVVGSWAPI